MDESKACAVPVSARLDAKVGAVSRDGRRVRASEDFYGRKDSLRCIWLVGQAIRQTGTYRSSADPGDYGGRLKPGSDTT